MMNYELFKEVVAEKFKEFMPKEFKDYKVDVHSITKVNQTMDGINLVPTGDDEAAEKSTVYLIGILILTLKMALYQFFKFKSL